MGSKTKSAKKDVKSKTDSKISKITKKEAKSQSKKNTEKVTKTVEESNNLEEKLFGSVLKNEKNIDSKIGSLFGSSGGAGPLARRVIGSYTPVPRPKSEENPEENPEEGSEEASEEESNDSESESEDVSAKVTKKRKRKNEDNEDLEAEYMERLADKEEGDEEEEKSEEENSKEEDKKDKKSKNEATAVNLKESELEKADRTLFVGNLNSVVMTSKKEEKALKKKFQGFGQIESIRFRSIAFSEQLPKNFNLISEIVMDLETCIIDFLQVGTFLDRLIELYDTKTLPESSSEKEKFVQKRKDGIRLLQQCVQMSINLDAVDRSKFYKTLVRKGLFKVLDYAFHMETDSNVRILATDTIITIIEHDILLIHNVQNEDSFKRQHKSAPDDKSSHRKYPQDYSSSTDSKLLLILSTILLSDRSPGLREQVVQALNTLLHPEGCVGNGEGSYDLMGRSNYEAKNTSEDFPSFSYGLNSDSINLNNYHYSSDEMNNLEPESESEFQVMEYFANFYNKIAPILFGPLIKKDITTEMAEIDGQIEKVTKDDLLLIHLVKLVSFVCTEHDRVLSRRFILENGILDSVSKLIGGNHMMQLRLTAVRCIKNLMCLDDKYYHRYMISKNLYAPVFKLFQENIDKNNLANSCIQDFFRIIITECRAYQSDGHNRKEKTNGSYDGNGNDVKTNVNNNRTNFTILNKYLVQTYGDVLRKATDIPFIQDMLETGEENQPDHSSFENSIEGRNDISVNMSTDGFASNHLEDIDIKNVKRLHSEIEHFENDPHYSGDQLAFKKSVDQMNAST